MRIIGIGVLAFVIWCIFSAWIYNDKLLPVLRKPGPVLTTPDNEARVADSLMKLKASMPADLLVYFDFDKSKFKADPQLGSSIAPFKAWLDKYPGSRLVVTGHTDLIGTNEYNMQLGRERARIVTNYIQTLGINAGRILTESKGETQPIAGYITKENRAKNRRTEITIKMQ
jgi:outer membrane protein OmpA-like peptidoglycan-associated protein